MAFKQGCHGTSSFSCSPSSLGIVLELHACAEGMGSCRGKRGKEHCRREESKEEEIQPWLVEHCVSSLVGDRFGCVVFLQQIDNISSEYSRAELGGTTRSAGHLGFEPVSPVASSGRLQVAFQQYFQGWDSSPWPQEKCAWSLVRWERF